ncbi:MAG: TrmJ/YjtD family RNA methyltransferase [Spirochaetes bacterium]|jgi:tRNA/rRNA methyltransferase|nr:TrmJ/YjtD family RNA methyltransferase [Spirochaetota bacterium]
MNLDAVEVVLVHPKTSANVGSVCRAMKTMGISRLSVVGRRDGLDEQEVLTVAVHAEDVYRTASFHEDLSDALSGVSLSIAATRRTGSRRNKLHLLPRELPSYIEERGDADVAIVFGSEEHGLTTDEVASCSTMVSIPSSPAFPSLNLSHAVQIITYELFAHHGHLTPRRAVARIRDVNELVGTVWSTLDELGFYRNTDGSENARFFRDIFVRAGLRRFEIEYLHRIFEKIRFMAPQMRK